VKSHRFNKGINRKALSDYLKSKTAAGGKFSYRSVAARAGLSHATIGNIIRMKYKKDVNMETLRAIAQGLEEDEDIVLAVAYGESFDNRELDEEFTKSILLDFEKLKAEDREFFRPYLFMMRRELDRRLAINQTTNQMVAGEAPRPAAGKAFMETPDEHEKGINIVKLTKRIQEAHPEISFETVVMVLYNKVVDVDEQTKAVIFSYAGQTDTGKDKHRTNGE
jgi:transcriptional regulator with XRE-family HTH domain